MMNILRDTLIFDEKKKNFLINLFCTIKFARIFLSLREKLRERDYFIIEFDIVGCFYLRHAFRKSYDADYFLNLREA